MRRTAWPAADDRIACGLVERSRRTRRAAPRHGRRDAHRDRRAAPSIGATTRACDGSCTGGGSAGSRSSELARDEVRPRSSTDAGFDCGRPSRRAATGDPPTSAAPVACSSRVRADTAAKPTFVRHREGAASTATGPRKRQAVAKRTAPLPDRVDAGDQEPCATRSARHGNRTVPRWSGWTRSRRPTWSIWRPKASSPLDGEALRVRARDALRTTSPPGCGSTGGSR